MKMTNWKIIKMRNLIRLYVMVLTWKKPKVNQEKNKVLMMLKILSDDIFNDKEYDSSAFSQETII